MTSPTPIPLDYSSTEDKKFWWQHLTPYHWLVLSVSSIAWYFDCLDQRIFTLARIPALTFLKPEHATPDQIQNFGKIVTAIFLVGWGIGGMIFGALGDKLGRTRMLTLTILTYSVCTGLSFFSRTWMDFAIFRFLTGLGVGGVFGLAVALVAETVPTVARTQALGLLQLASTFGNITASLVLMGVNALELQGLLPKNEGWRYMFLVGAVPSLLVIVTAFYLKEPEPWLRLKQQGLLPKGNVFSPYGRLFTQLRWRRNLIVGALIASTGVIGLWGIGEYAADLQKNVFKTYYNTSSHGTLSPDQVSARANDAIALAFLLSQIAAAIGMWIFTRLAMALGRLPAFLIGFSAALIATVLVYARMSTPMDAYWMMPLMSMGQFSVFAGFSIYLPELFPSSIRSTGTSFCYNLGRFAAAGGSLFSYVLAKQVFAVPGNPNSPLPYRYSAICMCAIFLVGLATLPFAPETKGQPLPAE